MLGFCPRRLNRGCNVGRPNLRLDSDMFLLPFSDSFLNVTSPTPALPRVAFDLKWLCLNVALYSATPTLSHVTSDSADFDPAAFTFFVSQSYPVEYPVYHMFAVVQSLISSEEASWERWQWVLSWLPWISSRCGFPSDTNTVHPSQDRPSK